MTFAHIRPEVEQTLRAHQLHLVAGGDPDTCSCGEVPESFIAHQTSMLLALGRPEPEVEDLSAEVERLVGNPPELLRLLALWAQPNEVDPTKYYWQLLLDAAAARPSKDTKSIERLSRIGTEQHAAHMVDVRASLKAHETYLAEHEDKPSTYLGRPQPGASPSFYGPDDVVVDGDWLASLEVAVTDAEHTVAETVKLLDGEGLNGADSATVLAAVKRRLGAHKPSVFYTSNDRAMAQNG